jgi:hypothetical protein
MKETINFNIVHNRKNIENNKISNYNITNVVKEDLFMNEDINKFDIYNKQNINNYDDLTDLNKDFNTEISYATLKDEENYERELSKYNTRRIIYKILLGLSVGLNPLVEKLLIKSAISSYRYVLYDFYASILGSKLKLFIIFMFLVAIVSGILLIFPDKPIKKSTERDKVLHKFGRK